MHIIGTGGHADMIESILKPLGMPIVKKEYLPGTAITIVINGIINTNVSIYHGCIIGDNVSVAPGSTICGGSHSKMGVKIWANATWIHC